MLQAKTVAAARPDPGKTEKCLYDGDNLMLRIRTTADGSLSRVWFLRYTFDKRKKLSLGTYPQLSLNDAREAARIELAKTMQPEPVDPKSIKETERLQRLAEAAAVAQGVRPVDMKALYWAWDKEYLQRHHSDQGTHMRGVFTRHVLSEPFADVPLDLVRQTHVVKLLNDTRDKGLTRTCGIILDNLRQMFGFAIQHEWLHFDPTIKLKKADWDGDAKERDRVLEEDEVKQLHKLLNKAKINPIWRHAIWFILSTGTRVEETLLAEKRHINLEKRVWLIPKENQKKLQNTMMKDHFVYLSDFAAHRLQLLLELTPGSKYVFPMRQRGETVGRDEPANEKTLTKTIANCQAPEGKKVAGRRLTQELVLEGGYWCPQDLRRSMSTFMQELDIDPDIIDKCQNHRLSGKVRRTYQRAELRRQKAAAWQKLGEYLSKLLNEAQDEYERENGVI